MMRAIRESLKQESKLITMIAGGFIVSLLGGMALAKWGPESIASRITQEDAAGIEQVEKIFGRFRDPVREGELGAMTTCMLIVFGVNTLGSLMRSMSTVFILPLGFLFLSGLTIGASLQSLEGSSFLSVFLFLLMVGLEWATYVLSAAAGTSIGLAVILPKRVGCSSRRTAFKRTLGQAGNLYTVIVVILGIQAVFEVLYVRKVLLMGGTGVPLAPW